MRTAPAVPRDDADDALARPAGRLAVGLRQALPASRRMRSRSSSADMPFLEDGPELVLRPGEPRGHGAHGQSERARDLLEQEIEPVVEDDDDPLRRAEAATASVTAHRRTSSSAVSFRDQSWNAASGSGAISRRLALRERSIARLTAIRFSHGPNGRLSSKRSSAANAFSIASCAASSARARSAVTANAVRQAYGQ